MNKTKKIFKIIGTTIEVIICVFMLGVSILTIGSTTSGNRIGKMPISNTSLFPVLSDSMHGTFEKGDLVIGKQLSNKEIKKLGADCKKNMDEHDGKVVDGPIITFKASIGGQEELNTHRVVRVLVSGAEDDLSYTFITKGDKEGLSEDSMGVSESSVIAVYKGHIDNVGSFIIFIQKGTNYIWFIILPLVLLFLWNAFYFVSLIYKDKMEKQKVALANASKVSEEEKAKLLEEAKRQLLEELKKSGAVNNIEKENKEEEKKENNTEEK